MEMSSPRDDCCSCCNCRCTCEECTCRRGSKEKVEVGNDGGLDSKEKVEVEYGGGVDSKEKDNDEASSLFKYPVLSELPYDDWQNLMDKFLDPPAYDKEYASLANRYAVRVGEMDHEVTGVNPQQLCRLLSVVPSSEWKALVAKYKDCKAFEDHYADLVQAYAVETEVVQHDDDPVSLTVKEVGNIMMNDRNIMNGMIKDEADFDASCGDLGIGHLTERFRLTSKQEAEMKSALKLALRKIKLDELAELETSQGYD